MKLKDAITTIIDRITQAVLKKASVILTFSVTINEGGIRFIRVATEETIK